MKVISLSQRKFKELTPLELPKDIFNTEAKIYDFKYKGEDKIFKKLYHQSGQVFANKLYTLEMLDNNKEFLPDHFYLPDYLLSVGGSIEGFTIPKALGTTLSLILNDKNMDTSISIFYLKKIGNILNQLKYIRKTTPLKDFYLNDLHDSNFIANLDKGELYVVDLDSCKIGANSACPSRFLNPMALLNNVTNKYQINKEENAKYKVNYDEKIPSYVIANENSDLYCYIIMILNYLFGRNINNISIVEFYDYMNYLEYLGVDKELIDCFTRIVINKCNKNPVNLLDSLTNEQIYRAKENVFKKMR